MPDPLQSRKELLQQAEKNAMLEALLAYFIHEINNPLTGVMLLVQTLIAAKDKGSPDCQGLVQIENGLKRVAAVVSGLLNFPRKEREKSVKISINEIIEEAIGLIQASFSSAQIKLTKDYAQDLPLVEIRPEVIKLMLVNLLLNAQQALLNSKSKKITVKTAYENDLVQIKIKDQGLGIDKEGQKLIFEPFFSTNPSNKCLGLGLFVAKHILRLHRGKIAVCSEEHKGTEVTISLPAAKWSKHPETAPQILIIDDQQDVANNIKSILQKQGYKVDTCLDAASAIAKVKKTDYDLIYLDIHAPGMSALDTFKRIKSIQKDARICIITAMSDQVMTEYLLLIKEWAVDKVVSKPVFKDMVLKTTQELLSTKEARNRILVIDDDALIRETFKTILNPLDYHVDCAGSGQEALSLFKAQKYRLIFLDLALPDKEGSELLKEFRFIDKDVKICVISGFLPKVEELLGERTKEVTNTVFCIKPISREDLIKITQSAIAN